MATKTKRKPKVKAKKIRVKANEMNRMVHKVAALDRAVAKISTGIDGLEKQLRIVMVALVCVIAAIVYVNHVKADAPQVSISRR